MRQRCLLSITVASLTVALAAPLSQASAATVSGTVVNAKGYKLLVMGRTRMVALVKLGRGGHFRLRAGRDDTLQLLRPNNTFFGPIVLAHSGQRAYEALATHNVALGTIRLRRDYAAPATRVGLKSVDPHVWARADRSGKPVGAGNLGLISHRHKVHAVMAQNGGPSGSGPGPLPPGGDPTHVGIITAFNADVTGAGMPNAENPASAQASGNGLFTEMFMPLEMSVNADASGVTLAQVSELVRSDLRMDFYLDGRAAGGAAVSGVSVDCGTLAYCATGTGTGTVSQSNNTTGPANVRWDGSVPANPNRSGVFSTQIAPNVGIDQIRPGDVFLLNYHTSGGDVIQPTALTTYFLTVPAVASYDAGNGTHSLAYPVAQGAAGTSSDPVRMSSGKITLNMWRPQRAALPGESGSFFDVGHLHYGIPMSASGGSQEVGCAAQYYSALSPSLEVSQSSQDSFYNQLFPLHDTADDAAANPSNQISFTLDLAGCLSANGLPSSAPVQLSITSVDEARQGGTDRGVQNFNVCLPGCTVPSNPGGPGPGGPGPAGPGPGGPGPAGPAADRVSGR